MMSRYGDLKSPLSASSPPPAGGPPVEYRTSADITQQPYQVQQQKTTMGVTSNHFQMHTPNTSFITLQ